jgi:hypothetical protein
MTTFDRADIKMHAPTSLSSSKDPRHPLDKLLDEPWIRSDCGSEEKPISPANTRTLVVLKSFVFLDVKPHNPLKFKWRFGRTLSFHLQIKYCAKQETTMKEVSGFLLWLILRPEDGGDLFLRNVIWFLMDYTALYPRSHRCENLKFYNISLVCTLSLSWELSSSLIYYNFIAKSHCALGYVTMCAFYSVA